MENNEIHQGPEIKAIAIKLPFDLQERILCFPFLHVIREKYPEADLHFITPKKNIEVLNLLPFTAYYHEFDDDEFKTIFDVHRFCANAKLFKVDLFISLTNSFVDACLGLGFKAKLRLGFSDNWKALVLTHKIPRPIGHHVVEDYFALYKEFSGVEINTRLRVISRDLTPIIPDTEEMSYIAINLAPLRNASVSDEWIDLVSYFEGQRIVFFSSDEEVQVQMLMDSFLSRLPKKNQYVNFMHKNWIELGRMLAFARGVISYSGPAAALTAYTGSKALILYENEDPKRVGPFYFLADVIVMGVDDPTLVNSAVDSGALKSRKTFQMAEVFGRAHDFFKLSIQ